MQAPYQNVLSYWFGPLRPDGWVEPDRAQRWFTKRDETDREIRSRFERDIEAAATGQLQEWSREPAGTLALILLLDQFPRNAFRSTARSFAYDVRALRLCLDGLEQGIDQHLRPIERMFFYMPLQHSEDPVMQKRSVECFDKLRQLDAGGAAPMLAEAYVYALRHQEIVDRFYRFPHRNAILGRGSTAAEVEFLKQPGSSF